MAHHRVGLARHTRRSKGEDFGASLLAGWREADLTPREAAMLAYAEALTLRPGEVGEGLLAPMREAGLEDRAILEVNLVVAYFAYANRIASGLGLAVEPHVPH